MHVHVCACTTECGAVEGCSAASSFEIQLSLNMVFTDWIDCLASGPPETSFSAFQCWDYSCNHQAQPFPWVLVIQLRSLPFQHLPKPNFLKCKLES